MRLYAHWLDGEYVRLKTLDSEVSPVGEAERLLKFHALFGNTVTLSDVQLIDSHVVLNLFSEEGFVRYLKDHKDFLEIAARPDGDETRFTVATAGLRRFVGSPGRTSSRFGQPDVIQAIAEIVLSRQASDPYEILNHRGPSGKILDRFSEFRDDILAMLEAVHHFCTQGHWSTPSPVHNPLTHYDVLIKVANSSGLSPTHEAQVQTAIQFIDKHAERGTREYRSSVLRLLDQVEWPQEHKTIAHTVVSAWNCAVEQTASPDGGSVGPLSASAPLAAYLSDPIDAVFDMSHENEVSMFERFKEQMVSFLPGDPLVLSWGRIHTIVNETEETRRAYQAAIRDGAADVIREALSQHVRAITPLLAGPAQDPFPSHVWVMALGGGAAVAVMGHPEIGIPIAIARGYYDWVRIAAQKISKYRVIDTLRSTVKKQPFPSA
ncbi:hypothetical protein [Streptomyces sp. WAC 01325]|uniref:hypothetical protein n=1 Tax=Streptomyces sp. WAC 01325 TaxID=2203202 RepID=UPI000F86C49C|nr:hypothetical protein [Streptomyces sp. WAC 01325]